MRPPRSGGIANDTTCVNVVDRNGNMFSATPSGAWLPSVIAGDTGYSVPSRLQIVRVDAGPSESSWRRASGRVSR